MFRFLNSIVFTDITTYNSKSLDTPGTCDEKRQIGWEGLITFSQLKEVCWEKLTTRAMYWSQPRNAYAPYMSSLTGATLQYSIYAHSAH